MSEIRERAKEFSEFLGMCGWWATKKPIVDDLMAELERVEGLAGIPTDRIAELECQKNACHQVISEGEQRIAKLEKDLKHVQNIAKGAMDTLPERWNMGFQAGLKQAIPYEKELTDALVSERQGRKDDNAALTEDILRLEAENARLTQHVVELERQNLHDGIAANRRIKRLVDRINELEAK